MRPVLAAQPLVRRDHKDIGVVSNPKAGGSSRLASLRYLGHWIGDLHQPLHISFVDVRGGNGIKSNQLGSSDVHADGPGDELDDGGDIMRELLRIAISLRQVADCVEAMPLRQMGDAVLLFGPYEELFRAADIRPTRVRARNAHKLREGKDGGEDRCLHLYLADSEVELPDALAHR